MRTGKTGKPIRARSVEAALAAVGKGIALLGGTDPRKSTDGRGLHPLLKAFYDAMEREDDPASRAHPANITILQELPRVLLPADSAAHQHTILLCTIGFFWLLRPAEYLDGEGQTRSQAFRLCDVTFTVDGTVTHASDDSLNDLNLDRLTRATLTFNDQKNAVRGEQITHAATADPLLCPCKALARLCAHLRAHSAPPTTPLHTYYDSDGAACSISPTTVTAALRLAATALESRTGIPPDLITARSLRPGGATALLCSGIDTDVIQLIGRWRSDAMMRYLRVAAFANNSDLAQRMLTAGSYTFAPDAFANAVAMPLPAEAPRNFLDAITREGLYHR